MNNIDLFYFDFCQYALRYKFIKNFKHPLLGECQLVREKTSNTNYILKEKDTFSQSEQSFLLSSLTSLKSLSTNQNLIQLHAYTYKSINQMSHCRFYLFYEYLDQDLEKDCSMHQKANQDYKETVLWKILLDLSTGLIGLLSQNLLGNVDLRLNNVLLYKDLKDVLSYKFFFWNFGLSPWEQIQRGLSYYKFYLSPEELQALTEKTDNPRNQDVEKSLVFCLGILLLNLAAANATYERIYRLEKVAFDENIIEIKERFMVSRYSDTFSTLIQRMINRHWFERPSLQEIHLFCKFPQSKPLKTNKLLTNISSDGLSLSMDFCKPEEIPRELLEKQVLKQSLAYGIDRIGPLLEKNIKNSINNSFEMKKNLLEINNKNLDDKLENLKHSFKNRLTLLQDRISTEKKSSMSKPMEMPPKTARKSSKFRPLDLENLTIDQVSTVKKLYPQQQTDYISDNEWSENQTIPLKKPAEIPEFISELEQKILYTSSGELKNGLTRILYPDHSTFIGQMQIKHSDSIRNGIGVYYFANKDIYMGEWQDNKIQGKGVYYFSEGEYYEGKFINFKRNGAGVYQYNTGNRYEGEWKDDQKSGFGLFVFYSNGNRECYEGSWLEDEKDGEGIYSFGNGDKFVGRWKKGKKTGKGMVLFQDKGIFQGEWIENYANGYGVLKYDNGDVYEGNYENGLKNGGGIYQHLEDGGSKYAGQWLEDERTGNGVYFYSNGDKYTGTFQNGKRCGKGEYLYKNGDVYVGDWMVNKKEGYGEFIFKKGGSYKGYWWDNFMCGNGFMMYCNGDYYEGEWRNGKKQGNGVYFWVDGLGFEGKWEEDNMVVSDGKFINQEGIRF